MPTVDAEPVDAEPAARRRSLQRQAIAWALAVLLLVAAVGYVWGTGGFDRGATPYRGPEVRPGDVIETRFWDVAVHEATIHPDDGELRLRITATNKQEQAGPLLTASMLVIRSTAMGSMLRSNCLAQRGDFQPELAAEATCVFSFEVNEVSPPPPGPMEIEVVVLDQRLTDGLESIPHPEADGPAAWLRLTAVEATEEEA